MKQELLMCRPTHFTVEYQINPWMNVSVPVDKEKALREWQNVYDILQNLGVHIYLVNPIANLPDMTFSGDCGLAVGKHFLASNFRHSERQNEIIYYKQWFVENHYEIHNLPENVYFEGLGDIVWYDGKFIFGYGMRASQSALSYIKNFFPQLQCLCELELADNRFYHLAIAISFIGPNKILYYPPAFTEKSQRIIEETFPDRIAVNDEDGLQHFVCNNITVGHHILVAGFSSELEQKLHCDGYKLIACGMEEFKKSGASIRCLALDLA